MILEWLYRRMPAVFMARRNLLRARARTTLATLGIVIGVVAIASLGVFGAAYTQAALENLSEFGTDLQVVPGEDNDEFGFDDEQLREIERAASGHEVIAIKRDSVPVEHRGVEKEIQLIGVSDPNRLFTAKSGAVPTSFRKGVLVGENLADTFDLEIGDSFHFDNETTRVVAILEDEGMGAVARSTDSIVVPIERIDEERYREAVVMTETAEDANATAVAIESQLNGRKELVATQERAQIAEMIDEQKAQINTFLLGVGAISLFVAGVSILNVMLMSVMERKREIGVLRAVGFQKLDVLRIVLTEAAFLGVVGAIIGGVVSIGLGMLINNVFLSDPLAFNAEAVRYIVLGVGFGVVSSAISGIYPAWKAAVVPPVEALRD